MTSRKAEIWVGVFVALGIAALFMLAMQVSNLSTLTRGDGYLLTAGFENVGGLKVRSPVTVSGVRVGRVEAIDYDYDAFEAVVSLRIGAGHDGFPEDTSASIYTSGLLGEQYIALEPGGSLENLTDGDRVELTQSALVMEQIIAQFLYSVAGDNNGEDHGDDNNGEDNEE